MCGPKTIINQNKSKAVKIPLPLIDFNELYSRQCSRRIYIFLNINAILFFFSLIFSSVFVLVLDPEGFRGSVRTPSPVFKYPIKMK